jgi:large subunit ribosomal protein L30
MSEQTNGQLKITLIRSSIGRPADQGNAAKSLGLRRLHHSVIREDNPSIRGQVNKISHLVSVEEIPAE